MDHAAIEERAALHRPEIETARAAAERRTEPTPGEIFDRDFPALMRAIDAAARQYCSIYNKAIGSQKLECHNHESGMNVESSALRDEAAARMSFFVEARRLSSAGIQIGDDFTKINVKAELRDGKLLLTFEGEPITAEAFVVKFLNNFTDGLASAEAGEQ